MRFLQTFHFHSPFDRSPGGFSSLCHSISDGRDRPVCGRATRPSGTKEVRTPRNLKRHLKTSKLALGFTQTTATPIHDHHIIRYHRAENELRSSVSGLMYPISERFREYWKNYERNRSDIPRHPMLISVTFELPRTRRRRNSLANGVHPFLEMDFIIQRLTSIYAELSI